MWEISQVFCLFWLLGLSVADMKKKKVQRWALILGISVAVCYQGATRKMDLYVILGGVILGGLFLLVSKITREGMGYGDSLGILALGVFLGIWKLAELLCLSFFLLFFVAMILFFKKSNKTYGIPFYPFLASGYLIILLLEGGSGG